MESNVTLKANEARIATLKANANRTPAESSELSKLEIGLPAEKKLSESRAAWRIQANALLDNLNENEWGAIVELLRSRGFSGFLTSYPDGSYGAQRNSAAPAPAVRTVVPGQPPLTPEERASLGVRK